MPMGLCLAQQASTACIGGIKVLACTGQPNHRWNVLVLSIQNNRPTRETWTASSSALRLKAFAAVTFHGRDESCILLAESCLSWPDNLGGQVAADFEWFKRQARPTAPELLNEGCRLSSLSGLLYSELFCCATTAPPGV